MAPPASYFPSCSSASAGDVAETGAPMKPIYPALVVLALGGLCPACDAANHGTPAASAPASEAPELVALREALERVSKAAASGDAAGVARELEAFVATSQDFDALFGAERGRALYATYMAQVITPMRAEAGAALVERGHAGQTEVTIEEVGPAFAARTKPSDDALLAAFARRTPMFSVRLHAPNEALGFRLDGFVRVGDRWVALLKLDARPAAAATPESNAPESAPPSGP